MAHIVHIEHPVHDYDRWKAAFDSDPIGRARSGVRRYRVARSVVDPRAVTIELDVEDRATADALVGALRRLWDTPVARAAVAGAPAVSILELVESVSLEAPGRAGGPGGLPPGDPTASAAP